VNCAAVPGVPDARAQELMDVTTSAVCSHISSVLFADHRDLLAFLLALDRLRATHKLPENEMSLWVGDVEIQPHEHSVEKMCLHGLPREVISLEMSQILCSNTCKIQQKIGR